jgi:zinc protease
MRKREGTKMMRLEKKSKWALPICLLMVFLLIGPLIGKAVAADLIRGALKNGLKVVVVRNPLAPVVTTMVNYLAGSNETPEGFPGMAHAQEHMMFRGSPGLSAAQLANLIAAMGGDFNADTQQTVTQYYFTVPAEDLELALRIEAVRMEDVLDASELWDQERGAIEQEVAQDYSNPMYIFYSTLLSKMFAGTPYAHDALGTRPSFQKTTGAMLKTFYRQWYGPNNAILVIVGDVDPKATLGKVKEIFEAIPSRPVPARPEIRLQPLKPEMIRLDTDLPYTLSIVAYRFPGYDSPDFAAGQVLGDILDSQRGDLFELVTRGKALMTEFNTTSFPGAGMGYALAAFPRGKDGLAMIKTLKEIIAGYASRGFPEELVEASKRRLVANAEFQKNSVEGLAAAWSQALAVQACSRSGVLCPQRNQTGHSAGLGGKTFETAFLARL